MSASGFSPVQTGVWVLLTGDVTLMGMVDGVFDDVPSGREVKYVMIGEEANELPFRTFGPRSSVPTARGHEQHFTAHVWTKDDEAGAGSKLAQQIIDRVTELMEGGTLAILNHAIVMVNLEFSEIMKSIDEKTNEVWRHGVARYEIIIQDTV